MSPSLVENIWFCYHRDQCKLSQTVTKTRGRRRSSARSHVTITPLSPRMGKLAHIDIIYRSCDVFSSNVDMILFWQLDRGKSGVRVCGMLQENVN